MYSGYRAELESNDWLTENAGRYADRDTGKSGTAYYPFGFDEITPAAERNADEIYRGYGNGDGGISEADGRERSGIYRTDEYGNEQYVLTGWENERAIFEESLYCRGQDEEVFNQSVLDFSDADSYFNHLGTDTAYLVGELTDIIDSTPYVEDCTTMKQPRQKKKKEQNHGPVMGGM